MIKTIKEATDFIYTQLQKTQKKEDLDKDYIEYILNKDVINILPDFLSEEEKKLLDNIPTNQDINEDFLLKNIKKYPEAINFIINEFITDFLLGI